VATIAEVHHDEKGIIWPKDVSPFNIHLIKIENSLKINKLTEKIYQDLQRAGVDELRLSSPFANARVVDELRLSSPFANARVIEVLYDDRKEKSAGEKFADADLIGIPIRIVISERTLKRDSVEIKERNKKETKLVKIARLSHFIRNW